MSRDRAETTSGGMRRGAGFAVAFLAFSAGAAFAGSPEDAYRRLLEGNPSGPSEIAPRPDPGPKPKVSKPVAPPAPKVACDRKFADLKARVDAGDQRYSKVCFVEERCSEKEKCDYSRRVHKDYAALSAIASKCATLPSASEWASKYAAWAAKGPELTAYACRNQ